MSPDPLFRATRTAAFSAVCVALATVGHSLTAPAPVPLWAIFVGFGAVLLVSSVLAGHERSLGTILGGLLGGQFALHSLYAAAGSAVPLEHHPATGQTGSAHGGLAMTLAHVAAAVLSAWWLRRGERASWTLARRLAARRPSWCLPVLTPAEQGATLVRLPVPAWAGSGSTTGRVLRHQVVRRGPPVRSRAL